MRCSLQRPSNLVIGSPRVAFLAASLATEMLVLPVPMGAPVIAPRAFPRVSSACRFAARECVERRSTRARAFTLAF